MSARSKARKRALDFLYEADIKKVQAAELFGARGAAELSQEPYVLTLLSGVAEHINKIDELIITYAQGWDMDRMPPIDRNILRIARTLRRRGIYNDVSFCWNYHSFWLSFGNKFC